MLPLGFATSSVTSHLAAKFAAGTFTLRLGIASLLTTYVWNVPSARPVIASRFDVIAASIVPCGFVPLRLSFTSNWTSRLTARNPAHSTASRGRCGF